jgi:hypothetical protein
MTGFFDIKILLDGPLVREPGDVDSARPAVLPGGVSPIRQPPSDRPPFDFCRCPLRRLNLNLVGGPEPIDRA